MDLKASNLLGVGDDFCVGSCSQQVSISSGFLAVSQHKFSGFFCGHRQVVH